MTDVGKRACYIYALATTATATIFVCGFNSVTIREGLID